MSAQLTFGDQINWNQVFYFSEIAAQGSIKAAAEKLELSPSTLSEHLGLLESALNVKLFHRQHRKLQLTNNGATLYNCARQMFESGKRFIDLISPNPLGCYPVSIGIVPGSSYSFAHGIINPFIKGCNVSVHVHRYQHDEMEIAIAQAKVDFGFTDRRSERRNLTQTMIVASELNFFVSHNLPDRDLKDYISDLPLVMCRSDRSAPFAIEECLDSADLAPKKIVVSEFPSLVESLCREGTCIAVLGQRHFENDPSLRMVRLPAGFPRLLERLYVTWLLGAENSEAIQRLKAVLPNLI